MATLQRRIGLGRAIVIGLASMVGAGVFFVWSPAAAGGGLLIGLVIAAVVATLNALSTTQLAMAHPVAGGSYAYARATIGDRTGFAAGVLFLAGKTASVAAIALVAGGYLWPDAARPFAVAILVVFAIVNMTGIRSTAAVSTAIVTVVLTGLAVAVGLAVANAGEVQPLTIDADAGWYGILQSAGLLFFCFAGYARMATLGEEVIDPRRTLPRAILVALAITLAIYSTVGILCVTLVGPDALAATSTPLATLLAGDGGSGFGVTLVRVVAGVACLGASSASSPPSAARASRWRGSATCPARSRTSRRARTPPSSPRRVLR